jgi:hypothetical protein
VEWQPPISSRVEVLTTRGLTRYVVFFGVRPKTRRVAIAGITHRPDERWMTRIARNLTGAAGGFLHGMQHVILDRDPLYTGAFRRLLRVSGVTPLVLPPRSPNLTRSPNALSSRSGPSALDRMVLLGEVHLRTALEEFVYHDHGETATPAARQSTDCAPDDVDRYRPDHRS